MRSLRALNSVSMFSTASCGPLSASSPAYCVAALVQELELTCSLATSSARDSGITP